MVVNFNLEIKLMDISFKNYKIKIFGTIMQSKSKIAGFYD